MARKPPATLRAQIGRFVMVPVWVLERCTDSRAIHLYALLGKYADAERRAWPKTERLAVEMKTSLRSVERAIATLRDAKALKTERVHRADGAVLGLNFLLIQVDPTTTDHPATRDGKEGTDQTATDGGKVHDHPATGGGAIPPSVAGIVKEELEPSNKNQEQEEEQAATPPALAVPAPDPVEEFRLAWNDSITASEDVASNPIKFCDTLTKRRRQHIRACLVEYPLPAWCVMFARVQRSSFCRGDNQRGWIASLDWLISGPDPAAKLLEGQYDDHFSPAELRAASTWRFRVSGDARHCPHDPMCQDNESCLRLIARSLRTRAS